MSAPGPELITKEGVADFAMRAYVRMYVRA